MDKPSAIRTTLGLIMLFLVVDIFAADYHIGPGQALERIGDVPWEKLNAGDRVYIHWRQQPYREKWVINRKGTAEQPIIISGVPGPNGERPVIDGRNARTAPGLSFWNEGRGVIKIGGSRTPPDGLPTHIIIEGLEIRSAYPDYRYTDSSGKTATYKNNAASIYIEKAANLTIRNCVLHDSGNGLFIGAFDGKTQNILIEKNHIYGNGVVGRYYEHNAYTAATNITFQYNRFGPLRQGAGGNNLKDRSAGLIVRHNWIEGGNRLLDLVESYDVPVLTTLPSYRKTYVYGNILIEQDGGNSQVMHYGGDSGNTEYYRKGTLYFYNNTLYSTRAGKTTLVRLSTNEEQADVRNNILYVTASGSSLALLDDAGRLTLRNNWFKPSWVISHGGSSFSGSVEDDKSSVEGAEPGFINGSAFNFQLTDSSSALNRGINLPADLPDLSMEYQPHQRSRQRAMAGKPDLGAFERATTGGGSNNTPPTAVDDSATTNQNSATTIDVLTNDTDADPDDSLTVHSVTQGENGTVTNNTTSVTYTPTSNFSGNDSFNYIAADKNGSLSNAALVAVTVVSSSNPSPEPSPEPPAEPESRSTDNSGKSSGGAFGIPALLWLLAMLFRRKHDHFNYLSSRPAP